ncbi:uncharacterized protein TNCV_3344961 [Trichonephila clavipes]|nr:uncharacterized protein TNCV_3344961 [Trichonephila clavipes]
MFIESEERALGLLSGNADAPKSKLGTKSIVNSSLNDQLSELWKLEEVPKTNAKIQIPDPCEESFSKSVKREIMKSFELQTITYGTSCAPFLALRTLQQLYQDEEQNFPLAAKIARENIYIDDLLSDADTEVEAKSIIIEIQNLLKSGGFILRKWSSSHPKVLQDLDTSLLASKPIHSLGDEESKQRVLGLIWNLKTDSIQVKVVHEEIVKTKRQLLSVIAQIFDPLRLFSPSVITLKIMLQELWKSKAFWDDAIPSSILENWNKFTKESKYLNSISIPRFMGIDQNSDIILHGFCDASTKAYAAVVYFKSKQEIHLVSAKTRVAPIKQLYDTKIRTLWSPYY